MVLHRITQRQITLVAEVQHTVLTNTIVVTQGFFHKDKVSFISLLMVVLTDVPRESVIWYVIL